MGVPVVTLAGNTHASRVGVSLLSALDLPDQIAASPDEYVERAVALATDPARLASLRASLRERFARSVLRDEIGFARRLEAAVRAMWQNRHATPPLKR